MAKRKRAKAPTNILSRLRRHLKSDPAKLSVLEQTFAAYERPNLHLAVEEILKELPAPTEVIGIVAQHSYEVPRLSMLSRDMTVRYFDAGPVEYQDVPLADGRQLACVTCGLYFVHRSDGPMVLLVTEDRYHR